MNFAILDHPEFWEIPCNRTNNITVADTGEYLPDGLGHLALNWTRACCWYQPLALAWATSCTCTSWGCTRGLIDIIKVILKTNTTGQEKRQFDLVLTNVKHFYSLIHQQLHRVSHLNFPCLHCVWLFCYFKPLSEVPTFSFYHFALKSLGLAISVLYNLLYHCSKLVDIQNLFSCRSESNPLNIGPKLSNGILPC